MVVALLITSLVLLSVIGMLSYKLYKQNRLNFAAEEKAVGCACGGSCGCGGHQEGHHHENKYLKETENSF